MSSRDCGEAAARPRILIVSFYVDNMNPTVRLWPYIFVEFADVVFFGPGHATPEQVRGGVAAFIRRHGPFDAVVVDDHIVTNSLHDVDAATNARVYARSYVLRFSIEEAIRSARPLLEGVLESGLPVLASQFELDCYNIRESLYERLRHSDLYIIGWGTELYPWLRDVNTAGEGNWIRRANDRWKTLVDERRERVISMPALVDIDEFWFGPLVYRKYEWAVVGTRYRNRARALSALRAGKKTIGGGGHYLLIKALSALRLPLYRSRAFLDLYNGGFSRTLRDTQFSYTCGSAMRMALRKFFEIPAAGAVLVCDPCYGFEALGFRDGQNAIVCPAAEVADRFQGSPDLEAAQEVATAGRTMVLRAHSVSARASQMRRCMSAIIGGTFRGAYWQQGELVLR